MTSSALKTGVAAITAHPGCWSSASPATARKDLWQHRPRFVRHTRWWPPFCASVDFVVAAAVAVEIAAGLDFGSRPGRADPGDRLSLTIRITTDSPRGGSVSNAAMAIAHHNPSRTHSRIGTTMRAVVQPAYGAPDVLEFRDLDVPTPRDGEVLVRVRAAGLNIGDWHLLRGIPYVMRIVFGLRRPRRPTPGMDLAGEVEAVGAGVIGLRPGDAVFGWGRGAFAEYASIPADNLMATPRGMSFEQAAAVGDSAFTALLAVRDQGRVRPGDAVLINGASGGVGTFAVQLAKSFGAEVTAVCSTVNAELVRSLGADHVIDYTREDFTHSGRRYDVMLDLIGSRSLAQSRRVLKPRGTYVLVGVKDIGRWFGLARQFKALCTAPFVRQKMRVFVCKHTLADLTVLKGLVEASDVKPVIDKRYDLAHIREAFANLGSGHARGKTVITL